MSIYLFIYIDIQASLSGLWAGLSLLILLYTIRFLESVQCTLYSIKPRNCQLAAPLPLSPLINLTGQCIFLPPIKLPPPPDPNPLTPVNCIQILVFPQRSNSELGHHNQIQMTETTASSTSDTRDTQYKKYRLEFSSNARPDNSKRCHGVYIYMWCSCTASLANFITAQKRIAQHIF